MQVQNYQVIIPNDFIQGDGAASGPANVFNLIGSGTASLPQFTIESLSRVLYNNSGRTAGQMTESDAYPVINNNVYLATAPNNPYSGTQITNQLSGQSPNGNYYATTYAYDAMGRQYQTIDANGTITDTVYDSLGRVVSTWVGTNDAVSGASGTPSYFDGSNPGTGNNMTEVSSNIYDSGGVGDGNLTETITYPDGNAGTNAVGTARVTLMNYDWRDRLVATQTGLTLSSTGNPVQEGNTLYPLVLIIGLDNMGNTLYSYTFSGDINGSPISMASTGANSGTGVPDQLVSQIAAATPGETSGNSPNLVAITQNDYDTQNRIFETLTYSVDPTTGNVSQTALTTYSFYGPRGNTIETVAPTGLTTQDVYNGAGWLVQQFQTDGGAVNNGGTPLLTYAAATSVAGDVVISQTAYGYDGDGNQVETVHAQRFNTDPITGTAAEGALFTFTFGASSLNVTPTGGSLAARIYYTAAYYDSADRSIATVNAGTNPTGTNGAAEPWARPSTAPVSSLLAPVSLYTYNPAGYLYQTTDANGNITANFYDSLGRVVETVASYGTLSTDLNQTTLYTYDGLGDQTSMTAEDPSTGNQTTTYIYGVSTATGRSITSNDLLYQTVYAPVSRLVEYLQRFRSSYFDGGSQWQHPRLHV